jgi:hypothetical protein
MHELVQFFDEWEQIIPQDARKALQPIVDKARAVSEQADERALFETWALRSGWSAETIAARKGDEYDEPHLTDYWGCWKDARATQQAGAAVEQHPVAYIHSVDLGKSSAPVYSPEQFRSWPLGKKDNISPYIPLYADPVATTASASGARPAGYLTPNSFQRLALGEVAEILPIESGSEGKTDVYFRAPAYSRAAAPLTDDRILQIAAEQDYGDEDPKCILRLARALISAALNQQNK